MRGCGDGSQVFEMVCPNRDGLGSVSWIIHAFFCDLTHHIGMESLGDEGVGFGLTCCAVGVGGESSMCMKIGFVTDRRQEWWSFCGNIGSLSVV